MENKITPMGVTAWIVVTVLLTVILSVNNIALEEAGSRFAGMHLPLLFMWLLGSVAYVVIRIKSRIVKAVVSTLKKLQELHSRQLRFIKAAREVLRLSSLFNGNNPQTEP